MSFRKVENCYLIKVSDDLIQQPETLHSLVVGLQLHIELREIADGGEHDGYTLTGLVVQLIIAPFTSQEVSSHILRQNVVKEATVVGLQLLHFFFLLSGLEGIIISNK